VANENLLSDFVSFKNFISSKLIVIVYAIGFAYITIKGLSTIIERRSGFLGIGSDFEGRLLAGLAIIVVGNLAWRILCEAAIIIFRIHDSLAAIEKTQREKK
jgi:hypothetical protein